MRTAPADDEPSFPCSLGELAGYFLRLGALGFGGPIALAGYMQQHLVEERRWIARRDYLDGLALSQLAPGPLAAQLAMYLGWVRGGAWGAAAIGLAFILPSFLMVLALSEAYVRFGGLPGIQGLFYGMGAAVVAIIARSAIKLAGITLGSDRLLWVLFAISALVTASLEAEIVWVFLGSGLVAVAARALADRTRPPAALAASVLPAWLFSGLSGPAPASALWTIGWFFAEAGAFVFGSGLAIVPFLHGGVVEHYRWLDDRQFLDAVAVAMITPGPVVITVAFIGYLVAGPLGACVAAVGVFLPCYLFVVIPAPYFRKFGDRPMINAFVNGVTSAAAGAIAGAAYVLGKRSVVDLPTALLAAGTLAAPILFRKAPEPLLVVAAGLLGLALWQGARP